MLLKSLYFLLSPTSISSVDSVFSDGLPEFLLRPLVSLSTTRELCAFAGAQDVVRGHIELFGMLLYVYSEGVETIIRSVSYVKFRAPWDWDTH